MKEEIKKWIAEGCEFASGKQLYLKYGTNAGMRAVLMYSQANQHTHQELIRALTELVPVQPEPKAEEKAKAPNYADLPDDLKPLWTEKNKLVRECDILKEKIRNEANQEKRREMAVILLDNWSKINETWKVIDNHKAADQTPEDALSKLTKEELIKLKKRKMTSRSKARSVKNAAKDRELTELINKINGLL